MAKRRRSIGLLASMLVTSGLAAGCTAVSEPLDERDVAMFAARLAKEVRTESPAAHALTVGEAVARARANNALVRARVLEASLADAKATALHSAMLPRLSGESQHQWRSRPVATRSSTSGAYSTSSDASATTRNVTLAWSPLDLGLAYLRTRQGLDRARQQHEEVRRVEARVAEEARQTFWRVVALDVLGAGLTRLATEVAEALALSQRAAADGAVDPMIAITLQRDILTLQRELGQLQTTLAPARGQLTNLVGIDIAGVDHRLVTDLSRPATSPPDSEVVDALRRRPEVRQAMYDLRISADEVDAVVLQALPTATLSTSRANDTNSFLKHAAWQTGSTAVAASLASLLRLPFETDAVEAQRHVHRQLAVVTAATIVMQVRVSRAQVEIGDRMLRDADRLAANQRHLQRQVTAAVRAGKATPQNLTRERLASLVAEARRVLAFGERDSAIAAYANARGDDLLLANRETKK